MDEENLFSRKNRHLDFFRQSHACVGDTLLDEVHLVARAFSTVFPDETDLSSVFLKSPIGAPLFLASVTGGTPKALGFNKACARAAVRFQLPMATGSLRIVFEHPETISTFDVNQDGHIPVFFGNIGLGAALKLGAPALREVCSRLNMDGLYLHVNHAQEIAQPKSERIPVDPVAIHDFIRGFGAPVCIKETGMGFSDSDIDFLSSYTISALDTGGAGGSNFHQVEISQSGTCESAPGVGAPDLGNTIERMGNPTALVIRKALRLGIPVIAGGGIRTGIDMARSMAIGAFGASVAAPLVHAWHQDPEDGINRVVEQMLDSLRVILALCGITKPMDLHGMADSPYYPNG